MYFELTAPDRLSLEMAYWDAQIIGLDPEYMPPLTFNIGTGSIEKVSRIRDKYNLKNHTGQIEKRQDTEDNMSDYKDGFQDGYKFAREEIMEKLSEIDINDIDSWILDRFSEMIEGGVL